MTWVSRADPGTDSTEVWNSTRTRIRGSCTVDVIDAASGQWGWVTVEAITVV